MLEGWGPASHSRLQKKVVHFLYIAVCRLDKDKDTLILCGNHFFVLTVERQNVLLH